MNESLELKPFQMASGQLPGCKSELPRTAHPSDFSERQGERSNRVVVGSAPALDASWLSGKVSPSHPLDFAQEVIFLLLFLS